MAGVVVLGEEVLVAGYALAGARVLAADDPATVLDGWAAVSGSAEVAVVVLTARAAEVLGGRRDAADAPLSVVIPS